MSFIQSMFSLEGKTALVTGPAVGIGQGIAVALAKAGANIVGISHEYNMDETAELIKAEGREFTQYIQDMGKTDEIDATADKILANHQIDILVNNAGIIRRQPAIDFSHENWEDVINVNLNGLFYLTQKIARPMIERKSGKIISIASLLAFQGGIIVPSYTASKHAVAGLTKAFANEWAQHNVQINAIAPGYIATNNTQQIREDENRNLEILKRIPANRWGQPSDLIGAAVFLASPASDYVNGHVLVVDGGWLAR